MPKTENVNNKSQVIPFVQQVVTKIFRQNSNLFDPGLRSTNRARIEMITERLPVSRPNQCIDEERTCLFATLEDDYSKLLGQDSINITCSKLSWEQFHYYGGLVDGFWRVKNSKDNPHSGKELDLSDKLKFISQAFLGCVVDLALSDDGCVSAEFSERMNIQELKVLLWRVKFLKDDDEGMSSSEATVRISEVTINFVKKSASFGSQADVNVEKVVEPQKAAQRPSDVVKQMMADRMQESAQQADRECEYSY